MWSDIEIWRSARSLVDQYGADAFARAEKRAARLNAKADVDGWMNWVRIAAAILELRPAARA